MLLFFHVEDNGILVEYAYSFLRSNFNAAQLRFYHVLPTLAYHCINGQCYVNQYVQIICVVHEYMMTSLLLPLTHICYTACSGSHLFKHTGTCLDN